MKNITLALAAVGALALSVPSPATAAPVGGLYKPHVEAGAEQVHRRCYHRRHNSRWRCSYRHRHWNNHHWRQPYHYRRPGLYFGFGL